jgi:hypothetical protein
VFTTKEEIAMEVKSMLEKAMTEFGYAIIQTLVTDIAPDQKVKIAMNEINAAQRLRVAAQDKAEAEKIMVVKAAEADAEAKFLAGTGIARQRQAIINGLRESVMHFQQDITRRHLEGRDGDDDDDPVLRYHAAHRFLARVTAPSSCPPARARSRMPHTRFAAGSCRVTSAQPPPLAGKRRVRIDD